jgi:hypothetical protein
MAAKAEYWKLKTEPIFIDPAFIGMHIPAETAKIWRSVQQLPRLH